MTILMEDEQTRHSRFLSQILDSLGYSEDARKIAIKFSTTHEILVTAMNRLNHNDNKATYVFGSWSEGSWGLNSDLDGSWSEGSRGLNSDFDFLRCDEDIPVVDRPDDGPASRHCLQAVSETNTRTGYTKLQAMFDRQPLTREQCDAKVCTVDDHGRVMKMNGMAKKQPFLWKRNGPADTITLSGSNIDVVDAHRYRKWPAIAMEWKTRGRCYNWPSTEVITKLCGLGCFLVPKGHSQSSDVDLEWMFSFSLQERELMRSMNAVQFKCYVLLKYIKTDKLTSEIGESITSYHCKTCLFYAIESTAADFWSPDNLITCLLLCLRKLCEWLKDGFCPNYFIREDNLFERKLHGELLGKTTSIMENLMLMENKYQFIFDLKTDGIGNRLSAMRSSVLEMRYFAEDDRLAAIMNWYHVSFILGIIASSIIRLLELTNNELLPCIETHFKLIEYLTNIKNVTEHTKEQTTEAIDLILPYLYTSLASHEAAQLLQLTKTGSDTERIKLSMYEHIEKGLQSCLINCQLKVAAIYYMLGEYEASEHILSAAPLRFNKETRTNVCICVLHYRCPKEDWFNDVWFDDQLFSRISSGKVSLSEVLKSSVSTCVMFLPTEKAIAPSAMLYDNPVPGPVCFNYASMYIGVGTNWAVVDFNAFGYYMQYLVYDKLGKTDEKRLAVKHLKQLIKYESVQHKDLASKLLDSTS